MRRPARLHPHLGRRQLGKKLQHLLARQPLAKHWPLSPVHPMKLKNSLRRIDPNADNLFHGRLPCLRFAITSFWHTDAVGGRPPHQPQEVLSNKPSHQFVSIDPPRRMGPGVRRDDGRLELIRPCFRPRQDPICGRLPPAAASFRNSPFSHQEFCLMSTGWIVLGIIVIVVLFAIGIYNRLVALRQNCNQAFADVDVQLKQRHDLIPNLVETVKGYAAHEAGTLEAVIQARNAAVSAETHGRSESHGRRRRHSGPSARSPDRVVARPIRTSRPTRTSSSCRLNSRTSRTSSPPRAASSTTPSANTTPRASNSRP